MISRGHSIITAAFVITALFLFSGCSGSNSTNSNENGNNGGNQQVTFDSGTIAPDESYSYTFDSEGTVEYYCQFHAPDMQGEVTVTSSAEAVERDTVMMENSQFQPSSLSVAPGTEVVWINNQSVDHNVTSGNPPSSGGGDY